MIILDTLLIGGLKFVLGKIVDAVDAELNDDGRLREELLAAQMRLELGEIDDAQFAALEADLLARIREIRERQRGEVPAGDFKVTGVEATFGGDEADARDR
ncbi:MAG: gas vesicle protein GvpG [Candidatus Rokuibacteriota bacterium]